MSSGKVFPLHPMKGRLGVGLPASRHVLYGTRRDEEGNQLWPVVAFLLARRARDDGSLDGECRGSSSEPHMG